MNINMRRWEEEMKHRKINYIVILGCLVVCLFTVQILLKFYIKDNEITQDVNLSQNNSNEENNNINNTDTSNSSNFSNSYVNSPSNVANVNENNSNLIFETVRQTESSSKDSSGKIIGKYDNSKFWITSQIGYHAKLIDKAMSEEFRVLLKTNDGGNTWTQVGSIPSSWALQSFSFVNENLGFFCHKYVEGMVTNFYRTENGGSSFQEIILPLISVEFMGNMYEPFNTPEAPWIENGVLYMYYAQDENGDYKGGNCKALLKSEDQGKTWVFTGKIVDVKSDVG